MRQLVKTGLLLSVLSSPALAVNPVLGWYGGFLITGSNISSFKIDYANPNVISNPSIGSPTISSLNLPSKIPSTQINYRIAGIGGGGQLGYRFNPCFRLEGEFMFNVNEYESIEFGNLFSINRYTSSKPNGLNQNGRTNLYTGFINAFYDFPTASPDSYIIPYVGVGAGYANVQNRITFNVYEQEIGPRIQTTNGSWAAQGIIGFSYFLDDFTSANIDYRYVTTGNVKGDNLLYHYDRAFQYNTLNFTMNFAFDKTA